MIEFQEKRRVRKFLYSRITLFLLIILAFFLLNSVWNMYQKQALTKTNLAKTAATFNNLKMRETVLSTEIARLKTESGTEEEIREKYGLIKPGEEVIVVIDKNNDKNSNITEIPVSFWQRLKNWFE